MPEELKLERDNSLQSLNDSHDVCHSLKIENHVLVAKVESLQHELNESSNNLKKFSSEKLDKMLHVQKHYGDKSRLRFDASNISSTSKTFLLNQVL